MYLFYVVKSVVTSTLLPSFSLEFFRFCIYWGLLLLSFSKQNTHTYTYLACYLYTVPNLPAPILFFLSKSMSSNGMSHSFNVTDIWSKM